MVIKLNLLKEIKSSEVFNKINKKLKFKKIELSNISFSINEKISLRSYLVDPAASIVIKDYF